MAGKCIDGEGIINIAEQFRFKAVIYDYDEWNYSEPPVVDVDMIDYKSGSIWHTNGFRSRNYKLIPVGNEARA